MAKKTRVFCRSRGITYTTDGRFLYAEIGGDRIKLALFDGHYYKLRLFNEVPVLEIDGVRMHLVKDFETPLDYAKQVVKGLSIPLKGKFAVLDCCTGLGYTAIELSKKKSAKSIVTCELSRSVIELAKWNPLSDPLFNDKRIILMNGSIADIIKDLGSSTFSFVVHDPPRFSHAPDLYSSEFYKELYRVCKKGAKIFHYVGSVGRKKGRNIANEVKKRLEKAGFIKITYSEKLQGLYGFKP